MNAVTEDKGLVGLLESLGDAYQEFFAAEMQRSDAHKRYVNALNRVNETQKKIDLMLEKLKSTAPNGSDWNDAMRQRRA